MNQADYITHVELENPNLVPEIRIYMYATTKHTSGSGTTDLRDDFDDNYATWYNTSPISLWDSTYERFDITPFAVNVGSVNYRTQDEFMSSDRLSSSTSLVLLKTIEGLYTLNDQQKGFHFDIIQPQDESFSFGSSDKINAFNVAGYTQDGLYADIEIKLIIRDQAGTDLGSTAGGTTLFRGLINSVTNGRNEVTIELLDGLIEARRKGNRVGETIRSEVSSYKERFYGADTDFQYDTEEVFDMSAVIDNRTYNLKHFPVIPPLRDTQDKVVKLKIQRDSPIDFFKRDKVSTERSEVYESGKFDPNEIYTNYNFTDGEQVEKIFKNESLNWKKFEVDWTSGILKFELPPIVDPEGSLFIEEYKTAYKYKHPAFLAEELFKELGYKSVDFSRENLSPYFPAEGEPLLYEWKIPSKRGVANRNRDGRNFGATAIHFCKYDNLYYYFSKGGIYKTDFETLNEKICSTHIRERYLDKGSSPHDDSTWKWKLVSDTTKGDDINELDVNQITVIKPNGKNTALRIIASVNRNIEFEEDNPYDIPYPRSRVHLGTTSVKGGGVREGDSSNTWIYPDRDRLFNWNYDDVNGYDDMQGNSYFIGHSSEGSDTTDARLHWHPNAGKETHNWDTSSFNRWRKDTIYTLYYFDIENYADDYYYYFNGSIYERTNAGVVTKQFDIDHDVDRITFFSSITISGTAYTNILRIDSTKILSEEPAKARSFYELTGNKIQENAKYPTSGMIIFPQKSEPTKLHNLDYDNATEDDPGYSMLPVDPLFHEALPHTYGKLSTNDKDEDVVSENPEYFLSQTIGGSTTSPHINYIGWQNRAYAKADLFYVNKHTLLYGDKLNNNFVIIEDDDNNKQILVALEIGHDESITGWHEAGYRHGYNNNYPAPAPAKDYKKYYEKAIYLCLYDISGTTLNESNKVRIGISDPVQVMAGGGLPRDYIGYALQRFTSETKIKDSFIGADILYEKENGQHLIYVLLNDVIMRFMWTPDHDDIQIDPSTSSMSGWNSEKETELKNALSISRHRTGKRLYNQEDFIRFGDWRTDNLFWRITDYNAHTAMDDNGEQQKARACNFINSRYSSKYISWEKLRTSSNFWNDDDYSLGTASDSILYGKIQRMFKKTLWKTDDGKLPLKTYASSSSLSENPYMAQDDVYLRTNATLNAPAEYKKELGYKYDLGCRSYQYLARGHSDENVYRISQIYGLTKMKGKRVFSVYTVNREYFSKITPERSRYDLEEKSKKYRNPDDKLFESNMEGMMAYQHTIDFDEKTYEEDPYPNLRLSSEIYPTAIHQEYYDLINELTSELQLAREATGGDTGKVDSNLNHVLKFIPQNTSFDQDGKFHLYLNSTSRGQYNWEGDLWMGITYTAKANLLHHGSHSGDQYSRIISPYKSKYWAYSVAIDKTAHNNTSASHEGKRVQWFFNKGVMRGAIHGGRSHPKQGIEGLLSASYKTFLKLGNFWAYLNSVRREYISNNILPSLLPKTSTDVGNELVHLIGNCGKYFSSDKLSGLADVWETPHPHLKRSLSNVLQWNKQDTHGTVSITTGNFDYPTERGGYRRYLAKNLGIMSSNHEQEIYKDFACKPIIESTAEKEDIHFVVGSSVGAEKTMKETILSGSSGGAGHNTQYGFKVLQHKKLSEPLKSRKLYDNENFMWVTLSHEIIPTIPLGDFSNTTIYDGLKQLAMVMDYEYGIEDNVPYFRPKDDYFYHEYVFAPEGDFDYIEPLPTEKELNAFYYMSGEVLFIKNTSGSGSGDNEDRLEVVRKVGVGNGSTVYPKELKHQKTNSTTYSSGTETERVSQIGLKPLYKIKMVVDERNIIDITKLNPPYDSNYTDIHLSYGDHVFRRKIKESSQSTKKIYSQSIPLIDNLDWVKFLGRKIQKEISYDRTRLELTTKINPSLRGADYIAVFFRNSEIKIGTIDNNDTVSGENVGNVYDLYKIKSVNHNLENFTSSIVADSVETSSVDLIKGGKIT